MKGPAFLLFLLSATICIGGSFGAESGYQEGNVPEPSSNPSKGDDHNPPPGQDDCGDPIGMIDGTVFDAAGDLRVSCPGMDLVFRRAYNSWTTRLSPLGVGWTHSYDWRIEVGASEIRVLVAAESGVTDAVRVFSVPPMGGCVFDADGYGLALGADGLYSVKTPSSLRYEFNAAKCLSAIVDHGGHRVSLVRETDAGPILRVKHSCGSSLVFGYSGAELVAVHTDAPEVWTEYAYRTNAVHKVMLSSVIRHDGDRSTTNTYEYTAMPSMGTRRPNPVVQSPEWTYRPLLWRKTDANGFSTAYEYIRPTDSQAVKCVHTVMDEGLFECALDFSPRGLPARSNVISRPTAFGVSQTVVSYDEKGREILRRTGGETATCAYDSVGDLVRKRIADAQTGHWIEEYKGFDAHHRVISESTAYDAASGAVTRLTWDERRGIPNRIVSPEGRVWEYEERGSAITVFGAGRNDPRLVSRILMTEDDRPYAAFFPSGERIDIGYGQDGRITNVVSSVLPPVGLTHDALGHISSMTFPGPDGGDCTTSFVNNWRGRPLEVAYPDGTSESFGYDGNGTRIVRHVDALGREDVYKWVLGLPVRAGRVINGVTNALFSVLHDRQLNVVAITDPLGRAAESYVLDENERVVAVTNLEGQVMTRTYALGNMVESETRFDGTEVVYDYDSRANLASVTYPDDTLRFVHDGDRLLTFAGNSFGTVSNIYDAAIGWLTESIGADGSAVSYLHSNDGGVTGIVSAAGAVQHILDAAGRRVRTDSPAGTMRYGYCAWNGLVQAVTNVNGVVSEYEYDVMDRVTNITWRTVSGARLGGFEYQYDALGRIVSRAHSLDGASFDRAYAYDDVDRLASDGDTTYTYDAAGNRMTRTEDGETVAYTLGVGDRLATWTGGAYEYDAAGCVTRITRGADTWDLTWNGQYQLVSVFTNGAFAESYTYDALGRRLTTTNAEGTERHIYDDNWQVIADLDENGNVIRSYVWGEGIDRLLAVKIGSKTYTALTDVQGTVWGYADEQGEVVARWTYDAWGNVLSEEVAEDAAELRTVRYRFQGREYSAATGLTNFRMRWYDAVTGRWLSKDPIGLSGGLNLYAFCGNDPLNLIDPMGRSFFDWLKRILQILWNAISYTPPAPLSEAVGGAECAIGTGSIVYIIEHQQQMDLDDYRSWGDERYQKNIEEHEKKIWPQLRYFNW